MSLSINTNVASLQAQNNLNNVTQKLEQNQERLSSGLRINSAADDAAGLAITDRMTSQIQGMNQASRNASNGISLAQTAEGGLEEITNIMQRMRELSVQSSNETATESDRDSINQEFQNLKSELDRIAESSTFNGKNLLDGSLGNTQFQIGPNTGSDQQIGIAMGDSMESDSIGDFASKDYYLSNRANDVEADHQGVTAGSIDDSLKGLASGTGGGTDIADGYLNINGQDINTSQVDVELTADGINNNNDKGDQVSSNKDAAEALGMGSGSAYTLAQAINQTDDVGVEASTENVQKEFTASNVELSSAVQANGYNLNINGQDILTSRNDNMTSSELASTINDYTDKTGVSATTDDQDNLTLTGEDGRNINISEQLDNATSADESTFFDVAQTDSTNAGAVSYRGTVEVDSDSNFEVEAGANGTAGYHLVDGSKTSSDVTTAKVDGTAGDVGGDAWEVYDDSANSANQGVVEQLGDSKVDTQDDALTAIDRLDSAISDVDNFRAELGSAQNRLDSTIANLENASQNLTEARGRIQDADVAKEAAEQTQNNVRRQAAASVLTQANQTPQLALQLLGG